MGLFVDDDNDLGQDIIVNNYPWQDRCGLFSGS
jgi:hypothetical protein